MPSYVRAGIRKCARIRALSKLGINVCCEPKYERLSLYHK